jgi:cell division protein ZapA
MEAELININVIIADRPYPLKVKPEEEEGIRKAAKRLNERVKEFQNSYEAKDKQDYLAMCALHYAVDLENIEHKLRQQDEVVSEKLQSLDHTLATFLQQTD